MISAAIITKNEAHNIRRCLESLQWTDEVVVVDTGSTDDTVSICKEMGCTLHYSPWLGFSKTKQLAVDHCSHDWILAIDADEEISPGLRQAIRSILEQPSFHGYNIKRETFYLGKKIRYSGWRKEYVLRLFRKDAGRYNNKPVHESVIMHAGITGKIDQPILHHSYPTIETHIQKMTLYSKLSAQHKYDSGKRCTLSRAFLSGAFSFFRMYILRAGLLDGKAGLVLAANTAYGNFLKYLYLYELQRNNRSKS